MNYVNQFRKRSNNVEKADHLKYLHNLLKLPWEQYDDVNIDLKKASSILDQEHYGLEEVKNRILESLVFITRSNFAKAPIICLVGPPRVGKTSIARSIANALGRKCVNSG
ncbi:AAA family ATPase [Candidatus Tisiphia endosymbiont of Micropterix aruncella]|uniref:AAA family ATPase n=1 Tax=Candidatus Tisiphia endosymbiont of Micropterix aruncella TaxID=3066271 RepID=UPI003AA7B226